MSVNIDTISDLGLYLAAEISKETSGPREAVGILAVVMARIICEWDEPRRVEAFKEFEGLARQLAPIVDKMLVRNEH